ncbi:hypothetical protein [Flavisolibacter tropicus]|uniref:Uncharacterized protein n=1 Tax=Flavisolibacter tropicus TaxID=1492898 RepID=A0A172TZN0_9BACT|nr:hypothetical protein [Flavisolibacter tropicus]ANE52520.1 hypothetical protein SY85_20590 [Flavisolibacter tropicus]
MNTFKHVLNTWLLSHLLHPFVFLFFKNWISSYITWDDVVILAVVSIIISIPALLLGWFFLSFLNFNSDIPFVKQGLWLFLTALAIILNLLIILIIVGAPEEISEGFIFLIPAIVSSWIAILIRTQQFQYLFTSKSTDNENSLV